MNKLIQYLWSELIATYFLPVPGYIWNNLTFNSQLTTDLNTDPAVK